MRLVPSLCCAIGRGYVARTIHAASSVRSIHVAFKSFEQTAWSLGQIGYFTLFHSRRLIHINSAVNIKLQDFFKAITFGLCVMNYFGNFEKL